MYTMAPMTVRMAPKLTKNLGLDSPQSQSCLSLLELCNSLKEFKQAHSKLIKLGLLQHPLPLTRLLACCTLCPDADMNYARSIFELDENPNTFVYNFMIRGNLQQHQLENALSMFYSMVSDANYSPNHITFPFVLKACSRMKAIEVGKQVHGQVLKLGFGEDVYVQNSLINLYSTCGLIGFSIMVLERMKNPDIVSWNSIIKGLVDLGLIEEARQIFDKIPKRSVVTWNCLIDGYVQAGFVDEARILFNEMDRKDTFSWNTMIGGFINLGLVDAARNLFDEMPEKDKDLITFKLMIDRYAREGRDREALETFQEMQKLKIKPDSFILVNALSACSNLVMLEQGEQIQAYIEREKIEVDAVLGTALVDMFSKCGMIEKALSIFHSMEKRDVSAWNAVIYNLGINGYSKEALSFFSDMLEAGTAPDETTFLSVLSTCRHCGLVEDGRKFFYMMSDDAYKLAPKVEHYGCMIDLLARANLLDEARKLVDTSDFSSNVPMWGALLGAASRLGNIEVGEYAAKHIIELDPLDTSCYIELSNLYSAAARYDKAAEIRKKLKTIGIEKEPGYSSIEVNGVTHKFRVSSTFNCDIGL
ncbi:hypothetical protein L6164_019507 [Bauhinia variegata]|uniref:Uncharacterized protein n=1 Tax=Bauhinia variegata TaxID=167791 RepID=A0ACB9MRY4_BAUVA|nr:hypothetical protein L6164_019507 [Bauhinia variegata]